MIPDSMVRHIYIYIYIQLLAWGALYMRHRGLRYNITSLMTSIEMVLETSVYFIHLTQLVAPEDFIECKTKFRPKLEPPFKYIFFKLDI
jgi:hypothetical protein